MLGVRGGVHTLSASGLLQTALWDHFWQDLGSYECQKWNQDWQHARQATPPNNYDTCTTEPRSQLTLESKARKVLESISVVFPQTDHRKSVSGSLSWCGKNYPVHVLSLPSWLDCLSAFPPLPHPLLHFCSVWFTFSLWISQHFSEHVRVGYGETSLGPQPVRPTVCSALVP